MRKFLISAVVVTGVITAWFWPNIYGQYRFTQYCKNDGGIRIYGKVLPDQGWLASGTEPRDYELPFAFKRVAFVRYKNKDGVRFDVYVKPNPWPRSPDYILQPVDESKPVIYMLKHVNEHILNELRLGKNQYEIFSISENRILVSYTRFGYRQFDQNKTLLAAPSGVQCPDENGDRFFNLLAN